MKRLLLIASLVLVLNVEMSSAAGWGRWRSNIRRARVTTQYRASGQRYQNDYQARPSTASSSKPWYINSEPAFRSQRNRILYSHLGYPYAFGD